MRRNSTFRYLSPAQALYLPDEVNFWTLAIVAVGSGFILTVAVSIYLICQTRVERPLPVRHHRTVRHISQGPDVFPPPHHYHLHHTASSHHHHHHHQHHLDDTTAPYHLPSSHPPPPPHHLDEMASALHYLDPNTSPMHDLDD